MNIAGTEYNLNHKALEIYISGCKEPHCPNCHNSALWDFNVGDNIFGIKGELLYQKCKENMIEKIWVLGGEPLDQELGELGTFLNHLFWYIKKPIWLWTRYTEIPKEISQYLTYAKIGPYLEDLSGYTDKDHGIVLASENQKIIKL